MMTPPEPVVTDNWLIYHDPTKLATTAGMIETMPAEARAKGAFPCGQCWPGRTDTRR
ncbi:hypothetical protein [Halopelagius fulvigenes]|uniref:Uncharacterized protein n=1 Tax=Halopelagius fulvigenes TaxID=1198324 RepID=A0ABD5TYP7_9EURY